jgi:hypothetical protein
VIADDYGETGFSSEGGAFGAVGNATGCSAVTAPL